MTAFTRRQFLKGCCAAAGANLGLTRLAFGDATDTQNILIVLFLRGGCDSLNLFPPLTGADRAAYEAARPDLMVPLSGPNAALDLNGQFGLHPAGAPLRNLYNAGQLAIVRATGNAVTPSRSHFDAMTNLEIGAPENGGPGTGWLTRYFQTLPNLPETIIVPSLAATSYPPTSFLGDPYVLTMDNPEAFALHVWDWVLNLHWEARQQEILADLYQGDSATEAAGAKALTALDIIDPAAFDDYQTPGSVPYPSEHYLAEQFSMLAQMIKLDVGLRVAALDFGGWDTHNGQDYGISNLNTAGNGFFSTRLVAPLAQTLEAFMSDLAASGSDYLQRVTIVVQSEFGRRFRQNADAGTDHGFGADTLVIGDNVNGGQFYGTWPGLGSLDLFEGMDVDITTDFRRILSEVLIRRLENPNLGVIFPGYRDYQPMGIVQGEDLEPVYDGEGNMIFSDGFED